MEDLVLTIPTQDGAFIETLAQRMGWTMQTLGTDGRPPCYSYRTFPCAEVSPYRPMSVAQTH